MTIEELKQHCIRQITEFERIKEIMPVTPNGYKRYEEHKIVLQLIEALEQQPCEDCISRQAVLEGIAEWVADGYADSEADISYISSLVTHLPSVTPKGKTGAWVPIDEEPHEVYECNACGWLLYDEDRTDFKYCPNCGAKMVEPQESEDKE